MIIPLSPELHGTLIAHADDVANYLIELWGRAVVSDPKYTEEREWHIEIVGLLGDIPMDTIVVFSTGARERLP